MSGKNLNLNKSLLGGIYRKYVRIKGGQSKSVRSSTRKKGGSDFGNFVRTYYVDDPKVLKYISSGKISFFLFACLW